MTPEPGDQHVDLFASHRRYLFAVAYRMLGLAEDAEDVLQDAWLRFADIDLDTIDDPRAYLVTIVARLSMDLLKSARRRREEYVGTWLPEPVTSGAALPDDLAEQADSVSFAFLILLERLTPTQRAVLVLHDVLDYSHDEVGRAIGGTPAASRQALRRARLRLGRESRPRRPATTATGRVLVTQFLDATRSGNLRQLMSVLAPDVVLLSDGGGRVASINRPLVGSRPVGRFFNSLGQRSPEARPRITELNGQSALLIEEAGAITNAFVFDVSAAGLTAIYVVRNPDKLTQLALDH